MLYFPIPFSALTPFFLEMIRVLQEEILLVEFDLGTWL